MAGRGGAAAGGHNFQRCEHWLTLFRVQKLICGARHACPQRVLGT